MLHLTNEIFRALHYLSTEQQTEFGKIAGINKANTSNYIHNKLTISTTKLQAIATQFHITSRIATRYDEDRVIIQLELKPEKDKPAQ